MLPDCIIHTSQVDTIFLGIRVELEVLRDKSRVRVRGHVFNGTSILVLKAHFLRRSQVVRLNDLSEVFITDRLDNTCWLVAWRETLMDLRNTR